MIVVVGLSHKEASIDVRERLAFGRDELAEVLQRMHRHPAIGEVAILSTCNRVEVYAAPPDPGFGAKDAAGDPKPQTFGQAADDHALARVEQAVRNELTAIGGGPVTQHLRAMIGRDALRHVFRVAASLDSLVVGEPQILGQLKDAFGVAQEARTVSGALSAVLDRAVRVGKRVRSETDIGAGQVSVSSVAVDLAQQIFGDLAGRRAALLGAGEMAEAAAKLLVRGGAQLVIVNRSPDRATALAAEVGGHTRPWGELTQAVIEADIVVSSTASPTFVVSSDLVRAARKARRGRSLFLIDIAVPRDIDPAVNKLDGVYLYDVDDLSQIVSESLAGRAVEATRAAALVEDELVAFEQWRKGRALAPIIVQLRERTRAALETELGRSLSGKLRHLGPAERQALQAMIEAATNRLLHTPVTRLKAAANDPHGPDHVEALVHLFNLEEPAAEEPKAARPEAPETPGADMRH